MTPALLLWLLPGYIIHLFHKRIRSVRNSSGWDFVALSGLYAAVLYFACMLTKLALRPWAPQLIPWEARLIDWMHLPTGCGLVPLAWAYALLWGGLLVGFRRVVQRTVWRIWPADPYLDFVRHWLRSHVFVSLKSGKVYVGPLIGATFDVNEATRSVSVSVELSGYRKRDTHQVVFDKQYEAYVPPSLRTHLFPYNEVATLSPFSYDLHDRFIAAGVTLLQQAGEETSGDQPRPQPPSPETAH